jgi:hypothetical protein
MLPYNIPDKHYDCVVALQVFEHLGTSQTDVFQEIQRISDWAILSFPYKWNRPGNIHHGIDEKIIAGWTDNYLPKTIKKIDNRIVYAYDF